jgi:hypothetical protein
MWRGKPDFSPESPFSGRSVVEKSRIDGTAFAAVATAAQLNAHDAIKNSVAARRPKGRRLLVDRAKHQL